MLFIERCVFSKSPYRGLCLAYLKVEQSFNDFTRSGFSRLLKLFEDDTDSVVKLTKAFALANKIHKNQMLSKAEPYINHPLRVALILAEELRMRDVELLEAAILHDAADSDQLEQIKEECGERTSVIVRAAAEPKSKSEEKMLEDYYSKIAKESKEVRYVILAERLDTARSMKNLAYKDRALRFKDEAEKYVMPIARSTDERLVFKLSIAVYEIR